MIIISVPDYRFDNFDVTAHSTERDTNFMPLTNWKKLLIHSISQKKIEHLAFESEFSQKTTILPQKLSR